MIGSYFNAIRSWQQRHDNGWLARVVEQPDGTFIAWAAPVGTTPICLDYIEDSLQFAQDAAVYALRKETGHQRCSDQCDSWNEFDQQRGISAKAHDR